MLLAINGETYRMVFVQSLRGEGRCQYDRVFFGRIPPCAYLDIVVKVQYDPPITRRRPFKLSHKKFASPSRSVLRTGLPGRRLPMDQAHGVIWLHFTRV